MRRISGPVVVLIGLFSMCLVAAVPDRVSAGTGRSWISFDASAMPFSFTTSSLVDLQGSKDASGRCQATMTLDHAADAPTVSAVLLSANPTTCEQVIRVGSTTP